MSSIDKLYELLVRRGYAQHEADYIAGGPGPDRFERLFDRDVLIAELSGVKQKLSAAEERERQLPEALSDLLLIFYRPRDEVLPGGLSYDLCIDVVQKACSALALPEQKETLRQSVDRMRAEFKSLGFDGSKIDINQDSGNG